jgi:nicotinamidase-related amidase
MNELLLIVDVQEGFVKNDETAAVLPVLNRLIDKFGHDNTVASRFINPPGGAWERLMDWHRMKEEPDTRLHPELKAEGLKVFEKRTYSAWNAELQRLCQERRIQNVYIGGIDTDQCVLATAIDIFSAGLRPVIVADACASSADVSFHDAALKLLERLIGADQLVTSEKLL